MIYLQPRAMSYVVLLGACGDLIYCANACKKKKMHLLTISNMPCWISFFKNLRYHHASVASHGEDGTLIATL